MISVEAINVDNSLYSNNPFKAEAASIKKDIRGHYTLQNTIS